MIQQVNFLKYFDSWCYQLDHGISEIYAKQHWNGPDVGGVSLSPCWARYTFPEKGILKVEWGMVISKHLATNINCVSSLM